MSRYVLFVLVCVSLCRCSAAEDEVVQQSAELTGDWTGFWTLSFLDDPPTTQELSLNIQDTLVVSGRIRNMDFTINSREILFDERENGVVYDEGDRLFRTNFVLSDGSSWSFGFLTDASGDRALVGDFFSRVGAIQRTATIPSQPVAPTLQGRWSGRFAALDNSNPDDAEVETGDLVLDCTDLVCEATGDEVFTLRFGPPAGSAWAGTVEGLVTADDLLRVRALVTPDGQMLAIGVCAGPNDVAETGLFCAYAALNR